jgi:hypothetical protein
MLKQEGIAVRAFDAVDEIINNIITTVVFPYNKLNSYKKAAK